MRQVFLTEAGPKFSVLPRAGIPGVLLTTPGSVGFDSLYFRLFPPLIFLLEDVRGGAKDIALLVKPNKQQLTALADLPQKIWV